MLIINACEVVVTTKFFEKSLIYLVKKEARFKNDFQTFAFILKEQFIFIFFVTYHFYTYNLVNTIQIQITFVVFIH